MLDNYRIGSYTICLGMIPGALPLVKEERMKYSVFFSPTFMTMLVILFSMAMNFVILKRSNDIENRFRNRIGPAQVSQHIEMGGGKMHPSLEHIKGVNYLQQNVEIKVKNV